MIVLSRSIGECIVIGGVLVLTLLRIAQVYVEISLASITGEDYRSVTLFLNRPVDLPSGIQVVLIRTNGLRARLGINAPPQVGITRGELGP